jgi:uncharacterized transporter YbjL
MLDDDEKHEIRMGIGNGAMTASDALTADDTLEAMTDVVEAGEKFAAVLESYGLPPVGILSAVQGAAVARLLQRLEGDA